MRAFVTNDLLGTFSSPTGCFVASGVPQRQTNLVASSRMKINEKNLCAFAVSATPVDKEGYLTKRGEVNKNFQRRYFVLKGNLLFYFEKKGDKEPVGVIILEGCTIELAEDEEQFCLKIEFHGTNNRSYVLAAESQESMESWMKALACAGYDYMKLMVAELQRQLDDIEDAILIGMESRIDNYQSGNSTFYVVLETPLPIPLTQGANSPVPPPRTRHNPFNRPESTNQVRTASMRSSNSGRLDESLTNKQSDPGNILSAKVSITFRELHNTYGRPILKDFNFWKHQQKEKIDNAVDNLISL